MYQIRAPGATVLFGDRTPDSGGYSLSIATDRSTTLEATTADGVTVTVGDKTRTFEIASLRQGGNVTVTDPQLAGDWTDPIRGCYVVLAEAGFDPGGFEGTVDGELFGPDATDDSGPADSTTRTSLELAVLALLGAAYDLDLSRLEIAYLAQRVETAFLGHRATGAPFAIALSKAGSALFLDADADTYARIGVPDQLQFLTVTTDPSDRESDSVEERDSVQKALEALDAESSPEVDLATLPRLDGPGADQLGYVVRENARASQAATALDNGDIDRFGELLDEAHHDLTEHLGGNGPGVDRIVETAREHGVYGVRAIGSDVVVAADADRAASLLDAIERIETGNELRARLVDPVNGVVSKI